jgi:hypothetical protein
LRQAKRFRAAGQYVTADARRSSRPHAFNEGLRSGNWKPLPAFCAGDVELEFVNYETSA